MPRDKRWLWRNKTLNLLVQLRRKFLFGSQWQQVSRQSGQGLSGPTFHFRRWGHKRRGTDDIRDGLPSVLWELLDQTSDDDVEDLFAAVMEDRLQSRLELCMRHPLSKHREDVERYQNRLRAWARQCKNHKDYCVLQ